MTKLVVIVGFALAFGAGLVVGVRQQPAPATQPASKPSRSGWLTDELTLTPEQQEQMRKIWSETARRGGREHEERRRQIRKERDEAISALISEEQRPQYEQVMKNYAEQNSALDREWRSSFQNAVERTKRILTAEQRAKYEEILQRHGADRGKRPSEYGRRSDDRATSQPAIEP